jgi:hypothetical protein
MATDVWKPALARPKTRGKDRIEFRLIYAASYAAYLALALIERASPLYWWRGGPRKSAFREAREAASNSVPYAFMG